MLKDPFTGEGYVSPGEHEQMERMRRSADYYDRRHNRPSSHDEYEEGRFHERERGCGCAVPLLVVIALILIYIAASL